MVIVAVPQVSHTLSLHDALPILHSTVLLGTQVMVGGVWSSTVTFWLQSAVLPQASVARHVRVASKVLPQWPAVLGRVSRMTMVTLPQASLAVGGSKDQVRVHSTGLLATQVTCRGVW